MKKTLCIFLTAVILLLTSCNVAEPIDVPDNVESPSDSNHESSSTPIEESTPPSEVSESEPKNTEPPLETIVDPDFHKNYNMFLYNEETWSDYFIDDVKIIMPHSDYEETKEYINDTAEKEKNFLYNGNNVKLTYKMSVGGLDEYVSADEMITVRYSIKTGKIRTMRDRTFDVRDYSTNEDDYKKLIVDLVEKTTGNNLNEEDYAYSCTTSYNTEVHANIRVPYFYSAAKSDEEICSYTIEYAFMVDGYETTDGVVVLFSTNCMIIHFDKMRFRDINHVDIEYEDAKAAVESFCRAHLRDDKKFISVDIDNYYLRLINDKMYLAFSVSTEYRDKESLYPCSTFLVTILIEIE